MNVFCKNVSSIKKTFTLVLCFLLFPLVLCDDDDEENLTAVRKCGGYTSLAEALSEFMTPQAQQVEEVQGFLAIYRTNCPLYFGKFPGNKLTSRHVFVVVEGTHRATRNLVVTQLAERLKAANIHSPPGFLTRTSLVLDDSNIPLRRAFFMMGIYGVAHTVRDMVSDLPIVSSGYFVDQVAFSIATAFQSTLPSKTSAIYKWPKDLLKPDIMFFINTPSLAKKHTIDPDSFRGRIVQIYRNWETPPPVVEINNTNIYSGIVDMMLYHIRTRLGYEGWPTPVSPEDEINRCFYTERQE